MPITAEVVYHVSTARPTQCVSMFTKVTSKTTPHYRQPKIGKRGVEGERKTHQCIHQSNHSHTTYHYLIAPHERLYITHWLHGLWRRCMIFSYTLAPQKLPCLIKQSRLCDLTTILWRGSTPFNLNMKPPFILTSSKHYQWGKHTDRKTLHTMITSPGSGHIPGHGACIMIFL